MAEIYNALEAQLHERPDKPEDYSFLNSALAGDYAIRPIELF